MLHSVGAKTEKESKTCQDHIGKIRIQSNKQLFLIFCLLVLPMFNFRFTQASPLASQTCVQVVKCTKCPVPSSFRLNPDAITLEISRITQSVQRDISSLRVLFNSEKRPVMEILSSLKVRVRERTPQAAAVTATVCLNYLEEFYNDLRQHSRKLLHRRLELRQLRISSKAFSIKKLVKDGRELLSHKCYCDLQNIPILSTSSQPSFDVAMKVLEILDRSLRRICTTTL